MSRPRLTINVQEPPNLEPDSLQGLPNFTRSEVEGHIYFYEDINQGSALRLITQLQKLDHDYRQAKVVATGDYRPVIHLHLNSYGGDAFASLGIADFIKSLHTETRCVIEGMAASGGTVIALACDKTIMSYNSVMLIHQQSSWFAGTYAQFKDEAKLQDILISHLVRFYERHSELDAITIREMLSRDYWMDAEEALEKGFIDGILLPHEK